MQSRRSAGQRGSDAVEASATGDSTARVGIILSSFAGGEDHFGGTKFETLPEPRPANAELSAAQVRDMTLRAIELGTSAQGGLPRLISRDHDVVILADRDADPMVVSAVLSVVNGRNPHKVTLVSAMKAPPDGVTVVNPATAESMRMPAPGIFSRRNIEYSVPVAVLHCDRLISVAPLRVAAGRPSLSIDNFRAIAKPVTPATVGTNDLVAIDAFGFHVAEYAVVGGTMAFVNGKPIRHNVVAASPSPVAADSIGASLLGLKSTAVPLLQMARKRGFGDPDPDVIWMRGNEIDEAKLKPVGI
ncbi:MAG: hypothetical protein JNN08_29830 [Bryobacterales bacterium]|nr:hypothetical protein [Bryobacterales bacterium]